MNPNKAHYRRYRFVHSVYSFVRCKSDGGGAAVALLTMSSQLGFSLKDYLYGRIYILYDIILCMYF